jgi:phosphoglycerate dehydrogenase-like enzyme
MTSSIATDRTLRILASQEAIQSLKIALETDKWSAIANKVSFIAAETIQAGQDFDIAFVSRDVTATSTKHQIIPSTQRFYDLLAQSSDLQWVHIHSAGVDRPIYVSLVEKGVQVSNSSGSNSTIVATSALAGILALNRHFPKLWKAQQEHRWLPLVSAPFATRDIEGQTAVIVGRGPIGKHLAMLLQELGVRCKMVGFSQSADAKNSEYHYSQIDTLLPDADWLVLACPLSNETRHFINKRRLSLLPSRASVINIARGEIVVEIDLIEALQMNKLSGAYLDVFEEEPLSKNSPLWDLENVILTPHSAGHSEGNQNRVLNMFLQNLQEFLR